MHIGIDLDNTVIDYSNCFGLVGVEMGLLPHSYKSETKAAIKKFLCEQSPDGQKMWMILQGQIYGPRIQLASLMAGVVRTFKFLLEQDHKISIVSHKTRYGHFDETKTELRTAALEFIATHGIFEIHHNFSKTDVYFLDTIERKIKKINELKCDLFIDDLPLIFKHKNFPNNIQKILFGNNTMIPAGCKNFQNWLEIAAKLK
jgi:hypothetical protein